MLERIADLTWRRPKLVLALVGAFMVVAVAVGRDVEHHLKAAGFTDSASESEKATALLRDSLGYDANPGLVLLVRARDGGRLDLTSPAVRQEVSRLILTCVHGGWCWDPGAVGERRDRGGLVFELA